MMQQTKTLALTLALTAAVLLALSPLRAQTSIPAQGKPNLTLGTLKAMGQGGKTARDRGFDNKSLLKPLGTVDVGNSEGVQQGPKGKEDVIKEIIAEDAKERTLNKGVPGPDYMEPKEWRLDLSSKGAKIGITVGGALLGAAIGLLGGPIGAAIGALVGAGIAAWLVGLFG